MTYSSISTNGFEPYGECLMGTRGTMIVEAEQRVMLYTEKDPTGARPGDHEDDGRSTSPRLKKDAAAAGLVLDLGRPRRRPSSAANGRRRGRGRPGQPRLPRGDGGLRLLRPQWDDEAGYEKDDDGKYKQRLPRCHGEVAMADAIIALTPTSP